MTCSRKSLWWVVSWGRSHFVAELAGQVVEHRIGNWRVVRLIQKWLRAGVLQKGKLTVTEEGTPQVPPSTEFCLGGRLTFIRVSDFKWNIG